MGAPLSSSTSSRSSAISSVISLPLFALLAISLSSSSCNGQSVLEFPVLNFSECSDSIAYVSSDLYNARGMGPLYQSVNQVIKSFLDKDPIPEDYIKVNNFKIEAGPKVSPEFKYGELLRHYWGVVLVIAIAAALIVLMPIIGLCFCCCRCAGACGGRSQPFDKKHDTCRRVFWGLLLICVATGLLFGVIVAFVTNSYMQEGIENVTPTVNNGMDDTTTYMDSTKTHIDHLLTKNYVELSRNIESTLHQATDFLIADLKNVSQAISLEYLNGLVSNLPNIKLNLGEMKSLTNELRVSASQLSDGLRGVKRELLTSLTKCTAPACKDVLSQYDIGKLDASGIDYNQLPDLTEQIDSVEKLLKGDIIPVMGKAMDSLKNLVSTLNSTIQENLKRVTDAMDEAGNSLKEASVVLEDNLEQIKKTLVHYTKKGTDVADEYIKEYSIYRFYFGVAVSTVLLLILVCITFALLCGICGKRPDGYGDDCCNKGAGSRFLMIGVAIIFLTISALALTVIVHFIVGIVAQRAVCVALRDPAHDEIFAYVNQLVDLNEIYNSVNDKKIPRKLSKLRSSSPRSSDPFTLSDIIVSCQRNESLYKVLHLRNIFDINDILNYPKQFNINNTLDSLINNIKIEDIDIEGLAERINELATSNLDRFDVSKFTDNLKENITAYPLSDIIAKLKETANKIPETSTMSEIRVSLKNQALHLESYQSNLVQPMIAQSKKLLDLAVQLESDLHFNTNEMQEPFESTIKKLLSELEGAQDFISNKGTKHVKEVAKKLVDQLSMDIKKYLDLVVGSVQNDIGRCGPIAKVYASLIVAGCNQIVDPFNGFWAGIGWCILLFLPTLIISVKLSSLYQKSDPYPGPLVELEYLYDAYSERDNIPLANGPKNKRRKSKERRGGSRDRRDYYEDSGSSHGVPATRDTRYNDMAPKHWDGGPPRYQNPPMAPPASEYERPPPYYYPGASEQD